MNEIFDPLIYGKSPLKNVVALEVKNGSCEVFMENEGKITTTILPHEYYMLYSKDYNGDMIRLKGKAHYGYADKFDNYHEYQAAINEARSNRWDFYTCYNDQERFMLKNGVTLFKGMTPKDVSILSFDIETTGIAHNKDSKVLLISNTFRKNGQTERRLFSYEDYKSQKEFIKNWADWVRQIDPSVIIGHNIFGFDIPYLAHCGGSLIIGRDGSAARISNRVSQFRKDGSQSYDYKNCTVFGRQIIDTFHLAIKYDVGRNYDSYGLKAIIKHEGLEVKDRVHYDAGSIKDNYLTPSEWLKIKEYAIHDADDSLALYDLMIPSYFYFTQSIPKTFQQIISGASGSQINSLMIRSYLQDGYGIPKSSERVEFEGGISFGNPGIFKNVCKVDVASLYPSIMLRYKIYDIVKDPDANFLKMVQYFTTQRLENKRLAKETGDRKYKDLEQSQKIGINSAYGFMGAPGLNFNSPESAAQVTRYGREILNQGIEWAEKKGYKIINADTDSFAYTRGCKVTEEMFQADITSLNYRFHPLIVWENDGIYKNFIVVKAKNYILDTGKEIKIKGSSLKATMKEQALKNFIDELIMLLLKDRKDRIYDLYRNYASSISSIDSDSIPLWVSKKTITKSVLEPNRTDKKRIKQAIGERKVSEGDKIYVFFEEKEKLSLLENFNGKYCIDTLYKKLYRTLEIFDTLIDVDLFPDYSLKRNKERL